MEIEEIAKEWAKREYFRQSMAGTVENDMTEEDYTTSVWERAVFMGDQKYRIMKGEKVDEEDELSTFQSQQDRKSDIMLKRAKKELQDILQSDGLGDDLPTLKAKIDDDDDDDDDDDEDEDYKGKSK